MPGGEDCEGTTGAIAASRDAEPLAAERKSSVTLLDAKPGKSGVTVAGGICGLTLQQSALPSHGMLMCMQHRCVVGCAGSTQVATDSSNTPTRVMATSVRWPTPRSMVTGEAEEEGIIRRCRCSG